MSDDKEEMEEATAWLMTFWTCPDCSNVWELEGEVKDEEAECPECKKTFMIRM